ncbi:MAG TPA: 23S rRNA (guanosine(2251)-2'-O)-methyltransferase RlmB [Balneolaceae bacterium]|nr:23S rRNA (guanosine(2251)-2'-O)-methyltransferase RlmB [Balneolaceae bacterium]
MTNKYSYGVNPILELLEREPDTIEKLFIRDNLRSTASYNIVNAASNHRIPVAKVPESKLTDLVGDVNHQGIVAAISEIKYLEFEEWLSDFEPLPDTAILCLDEIEDPHNLGAILRTAAAAGISAVIVPKHRQAPVNATVLKTSAGTAGLIPIVRAVNLNQAILSLKENKFWIAGLDQTAESSIWDQTYDVPMAFVIGNEGRGMRKKTGEHCDFLLSMPMQNGVESLNASVSAALICYEWKRQLIQRKK